MTLIYVHHTPNIPDLQDLQSMKKNCIQHLFLLLSFIYILILNFSNVREQNYQDDVYPTYRGI